VGDFCLSNEDKRTRAPLKLFTPVLPVLHVWIQSGSIAIPFHTRQLSGSLTAGPF